MSATQPLIFLPQKEIIEIIPDYKKYFSYFNRTKIFNRLQKAIAMADFVIEVKDYIVENPKKDVLVILNTKKHSKACFENLRYEIIDQKDEIYYLSTLITPFERKIIIKKIKDKSDKRKIIISTQLIEAGVDISVDTVFRAIAPIDSIIQAAGRANRYQEKEYQGEVYLYEIEEMKKATTMIYGSDLIKKTQNVLKGIESIEEKDYLILIEKYFIEVRKQSEAHTSKYIKGISKLNFKDVGDFSFIEDQNTESVFLQLDDNAKEVWEKYKEIYENETLKRYEKKQLFAQLKTVFYDYVINVPVPYGKKNIGFDSEPVLNFYVSLLESPSRFYNYGSDNFKENTGYQNISTLTF
jgi:CRISPR-associated endonuclease/helicase Cas3